MSLSATDYDILDRFVKGAEPAQIAEATGQRLLDVRNVVNNLASGNRTRARVLLDQQKPPEASPLVAPITKPKALKPKAPTSVTVEGDAEQVAEGINVLAATTAKATTPVVDLDDLDTPEGVMAAGRDHHLHAIRTAAAKAAALLADVRNQIIADRQEAAVKARIAELEAEIAALRDLVAA